MNIAERCFEYQLAEDALFSALHDIIAGTDLDKCLEDDFKWEVIDCCTDEYDGSVEVLMSPDAPPLTREMADKILAMGFGCIYESRGDIGVQWLKGSSGPCSPRPVSDDRYQLLKARAYIKRLQKEAGDLRW